MRTLAPPTARGWEIWNWTDELRSCHRCWPRRSERLRDAGAHRPGDRPHSTYGLTIHESIGPRNRIRPCHRATRLPMPGHRLPPQTNSAPALRLAGDERDRRPYCRIRLGHRRLRRRGSGRAELGSSVTALPARPGVRPTVGGATPNGCSHATRHHVPIQRMANISLQPGIEDLSTADLDRPGRRRDLYCRRQVMVDRHAALATSVHRPTLSVRGGCTAAA